MAVYIVSKIDNREYCKSNGQFTKHLRNNNLTYQEYYEKYITGVIETCPFCPLPKKFYQKNHTYANTCGQTKCVGKQIRIVKESYSAEKWEQQRNEYRKTMSKKTDTEKNEMYQKRRDTNLKIGNDGLNGYGRQKQSSQNTKLRRYGNSKYNNPAQISKSKQKRTAYQNEKSNAQRRKTMKEKYGVEYNFLRENNTSKSMYGNNSLKEYLLPSGKMVKIMGYENKALEKLFEQYKEEEIIIGQFNGLKKKEDYTIEVFRYHDCNSISRYYYPDIYIPSEHKIIEVKSRWWYDGYGQEKYKNRLENNLRKRKACVNRGYDFEFWIWDGHKKEFEIKR